MLASKVAEKRGVRIDWGMAWAAWAWAGIGACPVWMSTDEILALAHERLVDCSDAELPTILAIADGDGADRVLIQENLRKLFLAEGGSEEIAIRKWRLLLLQELLDSPKTRSNNHHEVRRAALDTARKIADFWGYFPDLGSAPLSVQGAGRTALYYIGYQNNLAEFLEEQQEWAEREEALLYPRSIPKAGTS